ncbi:glycoside hydrolase family 2 sugar binding [Caldicellulosiruptor obsidiansis OB47]|uniref:Glycoside hydrolase family 2 sugar binding n=1 Tax=Caldicellulosiruptor obsidiansis (strain ATCC BAA-2073 / JCM 16842 / OB47) TaxID=608506 RepID=D9TJC4_CALOO|nr:glycoside hydrolase family 2 TIM barrel-domain containing protein [Caldicellulosiruptor obsidiansis]ADL42106.1 glycoside hydrolase family 2 sugar binding [Caldicellulosiruptor obsidiansis OB47]
MQKINLDRSWEYLELGFANVLSLTNSEYEWKKVDLPHDAVIEKERSEANPSGAGEGYTAGCSLYYKKELFLNEQWQGKNLILEFEGIMGIAEVFINGRLVAKHFNGYTSFLIDITKHVKFDDKNIIIVRVENTHKPSSRWYAGCGIYRHVWLHIGGKVYIKPWHLHVQTREIENQTAKLEVKAVILNSVNEEIEGVIKFDVFSKEEKLVLSSEEKFLIGENEEEVISKTLELKPFKYWDVEDPYLYKIQATIICYESVEDSASTLFGIRTISVDPKEGFKLNGKPLKLKGGCIHHDNGPLGSVSFDRAEEKKVELLKASGFNALRLAHNPFAPAFLDACDRLGMLVIEEFFDVWHAGKVSFDYHLFFDKYWEEDLESTIMRDYNHPSIIMWSIGNEITWGVGVDVDDHSSYSIYSWCERLAKKVKSLDSSRLVTAALCAIPDDYKRLFAIIEKGNYVIRMLKQEADVIEDKWGEFSEKFSKFLDVVGYNYKVDRYRYDRYKYPNRIICGTETYPYTLFKNWKETMENSNVIGDFVWTAIDYLGEAGLGRVSIEVDDLKSFCGSYPWFLANCGDIDICGEKRPQSYYRDVVWGNRKDPYIVILPPQVYGKKLYFKPWAWEPVERSHTFPGCEGMPIEIHIYANADEVELFVNGRSLGRKEADVSTEFKAVYDTIYEPGVIEAVAYKDGKEIGRDKIETTDEPAALKLVPDREVISSCYGDLCYIKIIAVDKNGREVVFADNTIVVEVEGVGELVALGTADPLSGEPFVSRKRKLYKGRALAIVKSIGKKGEFELKAWAEGLDGAQVFVKCI